MDDQRGTGSVTVRTETTPSRRSVSGSRHEEVAGPGRSGGLLGPRLMVGRSQLGTGAGHQAVVGQLGPEVRTVLVHHDAPLVAGLRERGRYERVHAPSLGPADLGSSVLRCACRGA